MRSTTTSHLADTPLPRRGARHVALVTLLAFALSVAAGVGLTAWRISALPLLMAAVMFNSWYGEMWHGLLTAALLLAVSEWLGIAPFDAPGIDAHTAEQAVVFLLVAWFVSWLNAARTQALREVGHMRDALDARVATRTAELSAAVHALSERVKELSLLHAAARALQEPEADLSTTLDGIVGLIPPALEHPEYAAARITTDRGTSRTAHFTEVSTAERTSFRTPGGHYGTIEMAYVDQPPGTTLTFLPEERTMLASLASMLHAYFEQVDAVEQRVALARAEVGRSEAEEANRLKDQFLASVSHELRTPLSVIRGWTQILQARGADADFRARALGIIQANADLQTRLVSDLLDVSRITSGKLEIVKAPFDLRPLVAMKVEALQPAAAAQRLDLTLDDRIAAAAMVDADRNRINQVLTNLLGNALKFTPPGGHITVTLSAAPGQVSVEVADTGIGIDPAVLPHVFERFTQDPAAAGTGGLGLGLSIVRHLIDAHGGEVHASSQGRGRGTRIGFTLEASVPVNSGVVPSSSMPEQR